MRTQVLAVVAGGVLLGGCYRMAAPTEDRGMNRRVELTRATQQEPLDVVGPRVDPRTRTGAVNSAGSIPDLATGRAALSLDANEPERQQVDHGRVAGTGVGGSGPERDR